MAEGEEEVVPLSPASLKLYEAQFFGFTPQTCMLRIYSAFQDCLHDILLTVEAVFVRKMGAYLPQEQLCQQARDCTQKLLHILHERIQRLSNRMETLLLDNVLSIPSNVLLPEDQLHLKHPGGVEQLLKLEGELAELDQACQAEVCAQQALQAELEEQKEVHEQLDSVLRWIEELQVVWRRGGLDTDSDGSICMIQTVKRLQDMMGRIVRNSNKGSNMSN